MNHTLLAVLIGSAPLLFSSGCCSNGFTGEAGERWYGWQREEAALDRALFAGDCEGPTASALELWSLALEEDAPEGTISVWTAGQILRRVAKRCPEAQTAYEGEQARLEAQLLSGGATEVEIHGWWRLIYLTSDGTAVARVLEACGQDPLLRNRLRHPKYRREHLQDLVSRAGRDDLADLIDPGPMEGLLEGIGDAAFTATSMVVAPVLGPLVAPK